MPMKQNITTICFRCDFGPKYGLGHLMRCISLAEGFQQFSQIKTICLTNKFDEKFKDLLYSSGMETVTFSDQTFGLEYNLEDYIPSSLNSITLFDNYDVTFEQMLTYKRKYHNLLAIDDLADRKFDVDLIVNQNINSEKLQYKATNTPVLLQGTDYVLLRKNILEMELSPQKERIFMSFGGGEVLSRIQSFLQMFQEINNQLVETITIDFILDVDHKSLESVAYLLKDFDKITFNLISQSYDLSSTMAQADFAITAGGSTVFELAQLGIPQLIFMIDKNQETTGQELNTKGFGLCSGYIWDLKENEFVKLFFEFLRDETMKKNMSQKGRDLVDGKGVERVVNQVMNQYNLAI
jgi:UDP-2,4-diacetamido-2,4,6-trideoxy-beta-L-altropyranose hydrolase